jgi:hypothetical protein
MVADEELMLASEARTYLGISRQKLAQLIRDGILPTQTSQLDKRVRLVRRADVERLAREKRSAPRRPSAPPL